jgi:hypothetical protein
MNDNTNYQFHKTLKRSKSMHIISNDLYEEDKTF